MTTYLFDTVFLGNLPDVDPDETNQDSELAASLLGPYANTPEVQLTVDDANDDGAIFDNENASTDSVSYDAGAGPVLVQLDSTLQYEALILRGDGTTYTATATVFQMDNGDVFLLGNILDGENVQSIELTSVIRSDFGGVAAQDRRHDINTVCLTTGTRILCDGKEVAVEDLREGDLVQTLTDGVQPVLLIGKQRRAARDRIGPIRFEAGSLGAGLPRHPLEVSPNHRMLVSSKIAGRMADSTRVLVPAKRFLGLEGVTQRSDGGHVTYWHVLFARHQVVFANDAPVESLLLAPMARAALPLSTRLRLPLIEQSGHVAVSRRPVFPLMGRGKFDRLLARSRKNNKPLLDPHLMDGAQRMAERIAG